MNLLTVSDIQKKEGEDFALKGISFTQQPFYNIAITGESGSGKSTLMKIIAGLVQPDSGEVHFEDQKVKGPNDKLIPGHPGIAYLSQHFELRNNYRVEELLSYANKLSDEDANALYKICQIDHFLKRKNDQLSGGEKQRIALARLLITAPRLLLLDEPFSNLDLIHKNTLKSVIHDIGEQLKISCILVSHDPLDTLSWADEIIVMRDGAIVQQGKPQEIYQQPVDAYVAGLFGKYNLVGPKRLFVRPENFKIVKGGSFALEGIIQKVAFLGSAWELEVKLADQTITVQTNQNGMTKGGTLYIAVPQEGAWFL
ncbi:ATP-binding cassette domain-containing protein [Chitinophaga sp. SYP-B3965]|uniref:ABC transporter ATP-binding protein n=1 Tax=Chitinophaga sp. SYP-B3965 TaxID=2663120 RepID=UPI001299ECBE|nr:ABC transporter ATP-binding protein [Chitinophaga sp. SYP-B3965]MRG48581.1 ATP-binding cassette domain-containing protein [Chitinophaga sp. SYP-B3965]